MVLAQDKVFCYSFFEKTWKKEISVIMHKNWIDQETEKTKQEVRRWPEWMRRDIPSVQKSKKNGDILPIIISNGDCLPDISFEQYKKCWQKGIFIHNSLRNVAMDMAKIMASKRSTDDERQAALATVKEILFPSKPIDLTKKKAWK